MKKILLLLTIAFACHTLTARAKTNEEQKMQWFADAKLGIFIHWGIYSVDGISESWSFFNNYVSHKDYMKQLDGFTAKNYDPQQWVDLIKGAGAKYAVITSKHHDGVALWDSKQPGAITVTKHTPAKRDVLTPFISSLKKSGLKTGLYFSLPDWSHDKYDVFTRELKRYDIAKEPQRFNDFINFYQGQLHELSKQYRPDLLWFDGDWEHSAEEWKAREARALLQQYNPDIILNSRLNDQGDYATPEQGVPVEKPQSKYWELCYTMNDSWGYQPFDRNYKTSWMLIRTLVDCISMGGNLLLDIGPKPDGTIPAEQVQILKDLGRWTKKHAEAIYGTRAGIAQRYFSGKSSLSKDKKTLYLYLENDGNGLVPLRGVWSNINKVTVVGTNENVPFTGGGYTKWLDISRIQKDKDITVLKVSLNNSIRLHTPLDSQIFPADPDYLASENTKANKKIAALCHRLSNGNNQFKDIAINKTDKSIVSDRSLNDWIVKHAEAFSETGKGLSDGHYAGLSALSKDKQTIYLFVDGKPNGPIALKGIENQIARIRIVGDGTLLNYKMFDKLYWSSTPGIIYIDIPKERLDKNVTVIAVLLDGPVKEHRREVKAIESNL